MRRVGDESRARDVSAETFEIAWRKWTQVPAEEPLPWLYRTAGYLIAEERRRHSRSVDAQLALVDRRTAEVIDAAPQNAIDRLERTLTALQSLPEPDRQVLQLHAWEGLDGKQLATALGCSRPAAGVRLHRARKRLERAIESTPDADPVRDSRSAKPHHRTSAA